MVLRNAASLGKNQKTKATVSKILQKCTYFPLTLLWGMGAFGNRKQMNHEIHQGKVHSNLLTWLEIVLTDCTLFLL